MCRMWIRPECGQTDSQKPAACLVFTSRSQEILKGMQQAPFILKVYKTMILLTLRILLSVFLTSTATYMLMIGRIP